MTTGRPGRQTLNAYVDSELSAAESAEVARALADDPALVDEVASLTRLKAAVQDSIEEVNLALPRAQRRTWRPAAQDSSGTKAGHQWAPVEIRFKFK